MYEEKIIDYKEDAWSYWPNKAACIKTGNYTEFSNGNMRVDTFFNRINFYDRNRKLTDNKLLISFRVLYNV